MSDYSQVFRRSRSVSSSIHKSPVSYSHEADNSSFSIDRIDNAKAANTILA